MNAGKAVYGILSANSGVTDIVGTNIFPEIAEQETAVPFIVYQLQNVAPEDTHDGPSKLDEVQFEFLCYADSYNAAADLGVAVRAALDRVSGTYNGVHVESVQFNDVDVEIEYDPRRYSQVLKFTFRIKRDDVTIALGTPVTGAVLGDLSDVDVTGVTNGQLIAYNSTSGNWEAANDAGGANELSDLSDANVSLPSDGEVLIYSGGEFVNDNIAISNVTGLQAALDAAPDNLRELTDVTISGLADNDYLQYDSVSGTWQNSALILGRNGEQYTGNYDSEAETLLDGATETVELYYTAQADGDGLHEDAQTDTATTGYDIRRKLYYAEKAQADPNTSGDWTQFADIADDTTYASAKATLLAYLKARTGGTVPISLKMTWEEVAEAPSFTGLLNESYGSGAAAAYGTRRLNGNYSGACMTIRRASDGTTTTIGFDGEDIDEAAIETFCTGTTCTVQVWHDQSQSGGTGSGNDATQTDSTKQPTIYTGGALVKDGGRLALNFDGTNDSFDTSWSAGDTSAFTSFNIASPTNNTTSSNLYDLRDANDDGLRLFMFNDGNLFFSADADDLRTTAYSSGQQLVYANYNNSAIFTAVDGNSTDTTTAPASTSVTASAYLFATNIGSAPFNGKAQEAIFYLSDKSTDRTDIEGNISGYYQSAKLLNEAYGSGAAAAYSVRLLDRDYTGSAIEVERSSDNTTQNIGFDSNGDLDESALSTFCSGTVCKVRSWFDQSGNGNDAVQTTHANQPTIYTGGAIVKENGRVAFNSTSGASGFSAAVSGASAAYLFTVASSQNSASRTMLSSSGSAWMLPAQDGSALGASASGVSISNIFLSGTSYSYSTWGQMFDDTTIRQLITTDINNSAWTTLDFGWASSSNYGMYQMQEAIFYTSDKSTDRTSIESNIGDYFTQNTPLLDTYTGAAAAYSLRKLSSSFSGSAIRVRRASDNTEQDIGFNVFNELDTVSLASFCSGTNGFVKTWFDQSGNSRDVTQTNTANQPKIYDSTTGVVTRNGKPFVMFSTDLGGSPHFETLQNYTISANDECIVSIVYEATTDREEMFQFEAPSSTGINLTANFNSKEYMNFNGNNCQLQATPTQGTALSHVLMFADGTDIKGRANGAAYATDASDPISGETSGLATTTQKVRIGRNGNAFCNESYIAELILYPSYSAIETGLESNINTFYSIY